jgi:phage replication-related protein YjqB (UPF0714/DUF867 family)
MLPLALLLLAAPVRADSPGEKDRYPNFAALSKAEREDRDFRITLVDHGPKLAVLAIHGGRIEPGTSEVARAIAGADASLYLFEGIKGKANHDLHITSARFDEPRGRALAGHASACVSVHGMKDPAAGNKLAVCLGGGAEALVRKTGAALRARLPKLDVREFCPDLDGQAPANIVNACATGVQLELSRSLRDALGADPKLLSEFAAAVRGAL